MTKLLEVQNLTKDFGGLRAVNNVSFDVQSQEILGLIGPNGAGKTTLFNAVSGVFRPSSGRVLFEGRDITKASLQKTASQGIVRTFQLTNLFTDLTVFENVLIGTARSSGLQMLSAFLGLPSDRQGGKWARKKADAVLDFMEISHLRNQSARNLPYGHQKMLAISVALAAEPRLLLLDESLTGMNPTETMHTLGHLRRMREAGLTLVVVEHNMAAVMSVVDRLVVLNFGEKLAEGPPSDVQRNQAVVEAYLGVEHPEP